MEKITISTIVNADLDTVWQAWNTPADVMQWNFASDDWHTTSGSVDLREGGAFTYRMEAKDGSAGFDFGGTYTKVVEKERVESLMGDRTLVVVFRETDGGVEIIETFDAEDQNPIEMQRAGWQSILDNFAKYVESK